MAAHPPPRSRALSAMLIPTMAVTVTVADVPPGIHGPPRTQTATLISMAVPPPPYSQTYLLGVAHTLAPPSIYGRTLSVLGRTLAATLRDKTVAVA
ncbi:hypothetical protein BGY98DRAFT_1041351 [Russula aff. rugulosa BPL654]|nr:hypothetical protein BGY98DRAFT_1041351 [Russula aff. rugulosa BPL654]